MDVKTGTTIYENILSIDNDGNPVSAATFTSTFYFNGDLYNSVPLNLSVIDPSTGVFNASFVPIEFGYHQYRLKNVTTGTIYMSDIYVAKPGEELGLAVYVGF